MATISEQAGRRTIPMRVWVAAAFAVMFLINAIPHTLAGFLALPLPTPFSGGLDISSPPFVNSLWGLSNLVIGSVLARSVWSWRGNSRLVRVLIVVGFVFAVGLSWGVNMVPVPGRFA